MSTNARIKFLARSKMSTTAFGAVQPLISSTKPTADHDHGSLQPNHMIMISLSWSPAKINGYNLPNLSPITVGKRWMELQGLHNWEGLLDPLDPTLRSEILRYGHFVEATYRSFDFDPSSPTYARCCHPKSSLLTRSGITDSGYQITRNLRATSGVQLPHWIDKAPSWVGTRSSWIGYVAVCQDEEEITRLGRRDVVIAYRGTATCLEWVENLRATLTDDSDYEGPKGSGPMVESGFLSLYTSSTASCPSLQDTVRKEIARVIKSYGSDQPMSLTITGHSLGAALAILTAYDVNRTFPNALVLVTVISFGGPRVGDRRFRCQLEKSETRVLRIVNSDDLITRVPGFVLDDDDVAGIRRWLQKRVEGTQWVYADVGQELRLSSRELLGNVARGNVVTCHDLKTYLKMVSVLVSSAASACPLKGTAKRILRG